MALQIIAPSIAGEIQGASRMTEFVAAVVGAIVGSSSGVAKPAV